MASPKDVSAADPTSRNAGVSASQPPAGVGPTIPTAAARQQPPRLFTSSLNRQRQLVVVGGNAVGLRDLYHYLLRTSWAMVVGWVCLLFTCLNALFGLGYWLLGGVANAVTYPDAFFFSVQTLATIGYGAMYPQGLGAELLMSVEAMVGLLLSAVMTGLAFAKFARPTSRVMWSKVCCVSDRDGIPTLMFRVANERMNHIVDANIRVALLRTEVTHEGETIRKITDLALTRGSSPSFLLSWTVMHQIVPGSPLYGGPAALLASQAEILLTLTGLDETLMQTIHSRTSYIPSEVRWGARFEDILGQMAPDGRRILDYRKFHDALPWKLTWEKLGATPDQAP